MDDDAEIEGEIERELGIEEREAEVEYEDYREAYQKCFGHYPEDEDE